MNNYDAFISYAFEDTSLAIELAGGLKYRGFRIWYAETALTIGDKLLDSIERGLAESSHGILLISKAYLAKGWPNYEMDTLIRQSIETPKKLLPIWHGVSKEEVGARHPGLTGIYALRSDIGPHELISKLSEALAGGIQTRALVPAYESPMSRFLNGRGELKLGTMDGKAFNLWDALIYFSPEQYPFAVNGELFTKEHLLMRAAELLAVDTTYVRNLIGEERFDTVWKMCIDAGLNPRVFE